MLFSANTSFQTYLMQHCGIYSSNLYSSFRYYLIQVFDSIYSVSSDFGSTFSGVLTDEHGRVQAIWGSFSTQVFHHL